MENVAKIKVIDEVSDSEDIQSLRTDNNLSEDKDFYKLFLQMNPEVESLGSEVERVHIVPPRPAPKKIKIDSSITILTPEEELEKQSQVSNLKSLISELEEKDFIGMVKKSGESTLAPKAQSKNINSLTEDVKTNGIKEGNGIINFSVDAKDGIPTKMIKDSDNLKEEQFLYDALVRDSISDRENIVELMNVFQVKNKRRTDSTDDIRKELYSNEKKLVKQETNKITILKKNAKIELPREEVTNIHSKDFATNLTYFNQLRPTGKSLETVTSGATKEEDTIITKLLKSASNYSSTVQWKLPSSAIPSAIPFSISSYIKEYKDPIQVNEIDATVGETVEENVAETVEEKTEEFTGIILNPPQERKLTPTPDNHIDKEEESSGEWNRIKDVFESEVVSEEKASIELNPININNETDKVENSKNQDLQGEAESDESLLEPLGILWGIEETKEESTLQNAEAKNYKELEVQSQDIKIYSDELDALGDALEDLEKAMKSEFGAKKDSHNTTQMATEEHKEEKKLDGQEVEEEELDTNHTSIKLNYISIPTPAPRRRTKEVFGPILTPSLGAIQPTIKEIPLPNTPLNRQPAETLRDELIDTLVENNIEDSYEPTITQISMEEVEEVRYDNILLDGNNNKISSDIDYFIRDVDDEVEIY